MSICLGSNYCRNQSLRIPKSVIFSNEILDFPYPVFKHGKMCSIEVDMVGM